MLSRIACCYDTGLCTFFDERNRKPNVCLTNSKVSAISQVCAKQRTKVCKFLTNLLETGSQSRPCHEQLEILQEVERTDSRPTIAFAGLKPGSGSTGADS